MKKIKLAQIISFVLILVLSFSVLVMANPGKAVKNANQIKTKVCDCDQICASNETCDSDEEDTCEQTPKSNKKAVQKQNNSMTNSAIKNKVIVKINGSVFNCNPEARIKNNVTIIPLRAISNALKAEVDWDSENNKITITRDNKVIELYLSKNQIFVDGEEVDIDMVPQNVNGSIMVPLRFFMQTFGAEVNYDSETEVVSVSSDSETEVVSESNDSETEVVSESSEI